MKVLSKERYDQARLFMETEARELEKALFAYEFDSGTPDKVWEALHAYCNEDGGFGRAIEPDIRCEASSALGTSIALRHLVRTGAPSHNELVTSAVSYLIATARMDGSQIGWDIVPPAVSEAPRAIWWEYNGSRSDWGNPGAELTSYLLVYQDAVPVDFLQTLTTHAKQYINNLETYESHELQCLLILFDQLSSEEQTLLSPKIEEMIAACVETNPEKWSGYCLQPIQVVTTPQNRYYSLLQEAVHKNLDNLLEQQSPEGAWSPSWTWGRFEQDWENARREWQGVITLNNLQLLQAFSRIEQ
ncbi:MAG: hypothetical protein K0R67_3997 [Paenibacillus sp.]|nr:hypothetical protein [Paenibacillus sp.]